MPCRKRHTHPCGDLSLAYQVFGDGPVELVFSGSFASHIELYWTVPEFVAFFERLSTFCRVLLFDKAGVGLSDPVPKVRTLDDRAAEFEAVMDAAGFKRAVLFGPSDGGPASIFFAATRPQRTRALILNGTSAYSFADGWDDLDCDPAELRARLVPELGEVYTPSVQQLARWQALARAAASAWGSGEACKALLPSVRSIRTLAMVERMSASPGMARAALQRTSGSMCGRSCRRSPRPPWSSMPATNSLRYSAAGTSPTTSPVRDISKSRAGTTPGSPIPTGS
jgi:pimeloyl-ACP methyl ester carboxylesterase